MISNRRRSSIELCTACARHTGLGGPLLQFFSPLAPLWRFTAPIERSPPLAAPSTPNGAKVADTARPPLLPPTPSSYVGKGSLSRNVRKLLRWVCISLSRVFSTGVTLQSLSCNMPVFSLRGSVSIAGKGFFQSQNKQHADPICHTHLGSKARRRKSTAQNTRPAREHGESAPCSS